MKRSRRGGRRPQGGSGGHAGASGAYNPNRVYDSNGPEIKIRGTASHVYEKYLQLARDANASGDRVMAESYLQHAEHYFRIMAATQAQVQAQAQAQAQAAAAMPGMGSQPNLGDADGDDGDETGFDEPTERGSAPSFSLNEAVEDEDKEPADAAVE